MFTLEIAQMHLLANLKPRAGTVLQTLQVVDLLLHEAPVQACVFSDLATVTESSCRLLGNCHQADGISPIYGLTLTDFYASAVDKCCYYIKHRMELDMVFQWIPR
jgi:hypothetical protein